MNPTLTVSQLVVLGAATVVASFALNAWFIRHTFARVEEQLEHFAEILESADGMQVRVAKLEIRTEQLEREIERRYPPVVA